MMFRLHQMPHVHLHGSFDPMQMSKFFTAWKIPFLLFQGDFIREWIRVPSGTQNRLGKALPQYYFGIVVNFFLARQLLLKIRDDICYQRPQRESIRATPFNRVS